MKNPELIWARKFAGVSQTRIAEVFGVSRRTVINWEQGHTKLPPLKFQHLIEALGINPELVPKNTQPEPTPVSAASPPPKEPVPVVNPSHPHKRTWSDFPAENLKPYLLDMVVMVCEEQGKVRFDVPDLFAEFLRYWGKDATPIQDAWRIIFTWIRSAEASGWVKRANPEIKDSDLWWWELTQKGWVAFEKDKGLEAIECYPDTHNRLFESLV